MASLPVKCKLYTIQVLSFSSILAGKKRHLKANNYALLQENIIENNLFSY